MVIPVANAIVKIYRDDQLVAIAQTDENGRVSLTLPVGRYKIVVEKDGYYRHTQTEDIYSSFYKRVYLERLKYVPPRVFTAGFLSVSEYTTAELFKDEAIVKSPDIAVAPTIADEIHVKEVDISVTTAQSDEIEVQ